MSYAKLPKTTQDHAIGFQSVNQANDNGEALVDLYASKHLVPESATAGSPFWQRNVVGKHNDILIARATADYYVDTTSGVTPSLGARLSSGIFGNIAPVRIDVGVWRIYLATPQLYFAVATPRATAAGQRKASSFITYGPWGASVIVTMWEQSGGSWAAADLDFSLCVWAERPSS